LSLRDARTSLSLPKMMAVMLGEWEEAVASITMAVAVTTVEVVIKAVEVATATVDVAAVAATTVVVVKATEVAAIRPEAAEEEATAEVVAVATITIEASEEMTEALTTTAVLLVVVASTMAHLAGADLKQLLKETISRTMVATTTEVATCLEVVDSEVLMALLSSLVDLETEVVASPTVAEAEEVVTVVDSVETLATMRALLSPLPRVSLTTLLLHTTMVASREVETPAVLPAHRAASTNRRAPLRVLPPRVTLTNRDPKLAAESLVPYTLATLIRTQLTLLFLSSLATRA